MNPSQTTDIHQSLERTLSRSRLTRYLARCNGDLASALALYESNVKLSEAFYTPLQCVEVCLRNTIYVRMAATYGTDWMINGVPPLTESSRTMIAEAIRQLQRSTDQPSTDAIVAELKFAFWVGMLGPRYDQNLWRLTLYRGFSNGGNRKRSIVHHRFDMIRRFRNRVAHHEPIFERDLRRTHSEIIEAIGWMCSDTAAWTEHLSRFDEVDAAIELPPLSV